MRHCPLHTHTPKTLERRELALPKLGGSLGSAAARQSGTRAIVIPFGSAGWLISWLLAALVLLLLVLLLVLVLTVLRAQCQTVNRVVRSCGAEPACARLPSSSPSEWSSVRASRTRTRNQNHNQTKPSQAETDSQDPSRS